VRVAQYNSAVITVTYKCYACHSDRDCSSNCH